MQLYQISPVLRFFIALRLHKSNVYTAVPQFAKNTISRSQVKVLGKLFGQRLSGSKKHWYPPTDSHSEGSRECFAGANLVSGSRKQGKNATRRIAVLNKLFMQHISDLMATGEASEKILGRGLQVTRVKISSDFTFISVFWIGSGVASADEELENDIHACSGFLRHELSQLCLMSQVPRIKFVRDKMSNSVAEMDAIMRNLDLGKDYEKEDMRNELMLDFFTKHINLDSPTQSNELPKEEIAINLTTETDSTGENFPKMRHDTLGLDHRNIMMKIFTKMRKSKQAWELYEQSKELPSEASATPKLDKVNQKLKEAAEITNQFSNFLTKRKKFQKTYNQKDIHGNRIFFGFNVDDVYLEDEELARKPFRDDDYIIEDER